MANVLNDLAGDIYVAADVVSREVVGVIPAATINGGAERAALNDTVRASFTRVAASTTNTPSMTIPEGTDQTVDNETMTLNKSKGVPIPWTGEDVKHVDNGIGYSTVYGDQIAQAMRTIVNEMETDLAVAGRAAASRAYGTAGTTPFGTANDYTDLSFTRKILVDNGAPEFGLQAVLDTTAGATFRGKQSAVNAAGTESILRQGVLLDMFGMPIRESAQLGTHTKGAMASATTDAAGYAVGATVITLATAGTGVVAAGDVITFAGDTNKYNIASVVFAGANPAAGDTITLVEPGLREAIVGATAITVVASHANNLVFAKSALEIAVRAPAMPKGGDAAAENMMVTDPRSGISFDISLYKGFQKSMLNVSAVWGVKAWKPEHIALMLG